MKKTKVTKKTKGGRITGLYIGPKFVDLVQLGGTAASPRLIGFTREEIIEQLGAKKENTKEKKKGGPEGRDQEKENDFSKKQATDKNHSIVDNTIIIQAVKRALRKSNFKVEEVIVNLSLENAMLRYFQMPLIPEQEWRTAIKFEAKRHLPFNIEDIFFDFQVVKREETKRMDVVFAAAQKKNVKKLISNLNEIGLKVLFLEPLSSAVGRVLQLNNQINANETTAIVNIVQDNVNINILKNNIFYFVHDIKIAFEQEPSFDNLVNEIGLSFNYCEKKLKQGKIEKIIICSDKEIDSKLVESFKESFKINVELGEAIRKITNAEGLPPGFYFAIGLALKGIIKSILEVNLWKQEEFIKKKASEKENFVKAVITEGILSAIILSAIFLVTNNQIKIANDELKRIIRQQPKVSSKIKKLSISQLKLKQKDLKQQEFVLKKVIEERIFLTTKLNELNKILPDNMWVKKISWIERPISLYLKGAIFLGDKQKETEIVTNLTSVIKKNEALKKGFEKIDMISIGRSEKRGHEITDFAIEMK